MGRSVSYARGAAWVLFTHDSSCRDLLKPDERIERLNITGEAPMVRHRILMDDVPFSKWQRWSECADFLIERANKEKQNAKA